MYVGLETGCRAREKSKGGGLVLCDVFDDLEEPVLRCVPLPVERNQGQRHGYHEYGRTFKYARNIGTTAAGAVRFVSIDRRCCCGGLLESSCPRSRYSFTLTTWTLDMDSMTWSIDGVLHCDELWALPGYEGLQRVTPEFPVVSMDDDEAVCVMVCSNMIIKVDTRSKMLLSVVSYNTTPYKHMNDEYGFDNFGFIPSQVSKYLN
jgi:hypothetical protein